MHQAAPEYKQQNNLNKQIPNPQYHKPMNKQTKPPQIPSKLGLFYYLEKYINKNQSPLGPKTP